MENQTNLELNNQAVDALRESAKWSMFLAILGFIGIGIMIIAALLMGSAFAMMPTRRYLLKPYKYSKPYHFLQYR